MYYSYWINKSKAYIFTPEEFKKVKELDRSAERISSKTEEGNFEIFDDHFICLKHLIEEKPETARKEAFILWDLIKDKLQDIYYINAKNRIGNDVFITSTTSESLANKIIEERNNQGKPAQLVLL